MESFKEFVTAGAFSNTAFTGYDNQFFGTGHSLELPTPTLDIPTKTIEGIVRRINYTENPISIHLHNGALWNLTKKQWDYLKSTNKEPKINSKIQIEMFLDGTIRSVNVLPGHTIVEKSDKENNVKSLLGGKTGKPERTFGKHLPF